jgi:hypothetical protein
MEVVIKVRASNALAKLVTWIDEQNTPLAGERWLEEFYEHLTHLSQIKINFPLCKDPSLARFQYCCFTYKDKWVVVCKTGTDRLTVYRFILGSRLNY